MKDLNERINEELDNLEEETDPEKRSSKMDEIEMLHKMYLDEKTEFDDSILRDEENKIKKQQLVEQKKDRIVKLGLGVVNVVLYWTWMTRGFRFEETGTYTSKTFQNLTNKFKPSNML